MCFNSCSLFYSEIHVLGITSACVLLFLFVLPNSFLINWPNFIKLGTKNIHWKPSHLLASWILEVNITNLAAIRFWCRKSINISLKKMWSSCYAVVDCKIKADGHAKTMNVIHSQFHLVESRQQSLKINLRSLIREKSLNTLQILYEITILSDNNCKNRHSVTFWG
jgi:hypothetical protein